MTVTIQSIVETASLITACGVIFGFVAFVTKWFMQRKKTTSDLEKLKQQHEEDTKKIEDELCVVNYGVLAALDALVQLGYNGEVKNAKDKLNKHLNKQAHDQL